MAHPSTAPTLEHPADPGVGPEAEALREAEGLPVDTVGEERSFDPKPSPPAEREELH